MLHAAAYGDAAHTSFLAIDESDVASGLYERRLLEAVDETLAFVRPEPRVLFVNVFCVDDFLGTDNDGLAAELAARHPGCRFVFEHTHPVAANEKTLMGDLKHTNPYAFVEPVGPDGRDRGVLLMGNFVPLDPACELFELLGRWGAGPVRQLFACATYDEYADLGRSRVALALRTASRDTLRDVEERLGIPVLQTPACYDPAAIEARYGELAGLLGAEKPDCSAWRARCDEAAQAALAELGDDPVSVDCQATLLPFELTCTLLDLGFNVTHVFCSRHLFDPDAPARDRLARTWPHVRVFRRDDPALADSHGPCAGAHPNLVAVGTDGQRALRAGGFVDLWHDEGCFGFHGVVRLMELLAQAHRGLSATAGPSEPANPSAAAGPSAAGPSAAASFSATRLEGGAR
jgi:hypothetical protein